ncbi:hypothetical protein HMI55_004521, partial [Coelomomyces lativittatus]
MFPSCHFSLLYPSFNLLFKFKKKLCNASLLGTPTESSSSKGHLSTILNHQAMDEHNEISTEEEEEKENEVKQENENKNKKEIEEKEEKKNKNKETEEIGGQHLIYRRNEGNRKKTTLTHEIEKHCVRGSRSNTTSCHGSSIKKITE